MVLEKESFFIKFMSQIKNFFHLDVLKKIFKSILMKAQLQNSLPFLSWALPLVSLGLVHLQSTLIFHSWAFIRMCL